MKKKFHILNGMSLKKQFPKEISGELIVSMECLVDGNVKGNTLDELFNTRAEFISSNYKGYSKKDYYESTVVEFKKMTQIPDNAEINIWFEDDLFCQVNFWFVVNLIFNNYKKQPVYLIRPKKGCEYNFGAMSNEELVLVFQKKIKIELLELEELSKLWQLYQNNKCDEMLQIAKKLELKYDFLTPAINAHKDRLEGRLTNTLHKIIEELNAKEFEPVFREFCNREQIYGFGDLQVKRLFDGIINKSLNNAKS